MKVSPLLALLLTLSFQYSVGQEFRPSLRGSTIKNTGNPRINYEEFLLTSNDVKQHRESRLISIDTFNYYSKDPNTIILDTRSKRAYDEIHISGAIHLNFSDFTKKTLAKVIPNKQTRILIYCNNNFRSSLLALADKSSGLALNIPTFINLYGYGYRNVYELKGYLDEKDERINFTRK